MDDRNTVLATFFAAVIAEALLLAHSGIIGWVASGPHTAEEVHRMLVDWRVLLSVGLLSLILWLAYGWFRLGRSRDVELDTGTGTGTQRRRHAWASREDPERLQSADTPTEEDNHDRIRDPWNQ